MFNSIIYVYYDTASAKLVDSFIHDTDKAAERFITGRIADAMRKENFGLLSFWRDCEVYKIDLSKKEIGKELLMKLSDIIPAEVDKMGIKNETR